MSVLGDAYKALAAVVTIEERIKGLAGRIDKVVDLTRLETIIVVTRSDGTMLRIAPDLKER